MDVEIFRGDNQTLEVTVKDVDGVVFDITGSTARFTVRKDFNTTALIEKSSAVAGEAAITDPTNGVLEIYLVPADTRELNYCGNFVYDVEVELPSGDIHTVLQGVFKIKGDVTYSG